MPRKNKNASCKSIYSYYFIAHFMQLLMQSLQKMFSLHFYFKFVWHYLKIHSYDKLIKANLKINACKTFNFGMRIGFVGIRA